MDCFTGLKSNKCIIRDKKLMNINLKLNYGIKANCIIDYNKKFKKYSESTSFTPSIEYYDFRRWN